MKFNVITGLPRSGSTLLCNLLNQNPAFYASSTSPLCTWIGAVSSSASNAPEFKSMLGNEAGTEARFEGVLRGIIAAWYADRSEVIFDKSRGWAHHALMLKKLFPKARIIVCLRDLRNIFASVEKHHRETAALDFAVNPLERTLENRAAAMFSPDGLIGMPLGGIVDLLQRRPEGFSIVQFEHLTENPKQAMDQLYRDLGEEPFSHNFDAIESTATDNDSLYLGKFPHRTEGKIEPRPRDGWKEYVSPDIAARIMTQFQHFNQTFGYK